MDPASLAAVAAVLTAMGGLVKTILSRLDKQEERFTKFLGNHMSANTKAMGDLVLAVEALAQRVEEENIVRKSEKRRKDVSRKAGR